MIYILGRQPAIGLAELESLYGAKNLRPLGKETVLVENAEEISFERIGGSIKVAKLLTILKTNDLKKIQEHLQDSLPQHLGHLPAGKLKLGISVYGLKVSPSKVNAFGLGLKKTIKNYGRSVRLVPNVETNLNSAQVLHNKLTSPLGWELLLIGDGKNTIVAQTTNVQDINSYTLRDRGRPKRDARVGMLPPKLAQIIVNLALGKADKPIFDNYLLDPFCGTGVILQEAYLMGCYVMGADIDERMVKYTVDNLHWLHEKFTIKGTLLNIDSKDATKDKWIAPFDVVASETYLGRPFTSSPDKAILQKTINDCDTIISKFLKNLASQSDSGLRACLAVPAWFVGGKIYHLKTLDHLGDLGYNRISFVHAGHKDLIYYREGQVVGRELLVIVRK